MIWTEKYRPDTLDSVVGNDGICKSFRRFIASGSVPHIILHGPSGIGKTSMIKALAKSLLGADLRSKVLHVNASDERGIKHVREPITDFISTKQALISCSETMNADTSPPKKIVILEEVDSMTLDAQFCLRRLLETHADRVRFFMTCNNILGIISALRSRCCEYAMSFLSFSDIEKQINHICLQESVNISESAKKCLISYAKGDLRKAISVLQNIFMIMKNETIEIDIIRSSLGVISEEDILMFLRAMNSWNTVMDARAGIDKFIIENDIEICQFCDALFSVTKDRQPEESCMDSVRLTLFLATIDNLSNQGHHRPSSNIMIDYLAVGLFDMLENDSFLKRFLGNLT